MLLNVTLITLIGGIRNQRITGLEDQQIGGSENQRIRESEESEESEDQRLEAEIVFNAYDTKALEVIGPIAFDGFDVGPAWPNNYFRMKFELQG